MVGAVGAGGGRSDDQPTTTAPPRAVVTAPRTFQVPRGRGRRAESWRLWGRRRALPDALDRRAAHRDQARHHRAPRLRAVSRRRSSRRRAARARGRAGAGHHLVERHALVGTVGEGRVARSVLDGRDAALAGQQAQVAAVRRPPRRNLSRRELAASPLHLDGVAVQPRVVGARARRSASRTSWSACPPRGRQFHERQARAGKFEYATGLLARSRVDTLWYSESAWCMLMK